MKDQLPNCCFQQFPTNTNQSCFQWIMLLFTSAFQLKQELVDFSSLNAVSIAVKLDSSLKDFQCQSSISVNAKANSAKLNETPTSQQSTLLYFNSGSSRLIVEYIYSSNSEGAQFAPNITASIKAALHSEGAQTFPTILSVQPHGPTPKLIVICNCTQISLRRLHKTL
jgi:hypothetical protein